MNPGHMHRIPVLRPDGTKFLIYQSQREILELLAATPLTMAEIAEVRGTLVPPTHTALTTLEREGYVVRKGWARKRGPASQLFRWTGKPFPRLPHNLEMSERLCKALAYSTQCETRLALLAKYEKGETA